jgi:hypothetical protein
MKSSSLKVGDIFEATLEGGKKGYVQYLGNDKTQLNSDVVRVFKNHYDSGLEPSVEEITKDRVDFYSHVVDVKAGIKDGTWKKIGQSDDVGNLKDAFFRDSRDYGNPEIKVSEQWSVWKMSEPMVFVGKLENENTKADIGVVTWPKRIVSQMQTGQFHGVYPAYK